MSELRSISRRRDPRTHTLRRRFSSSSAGVLGMRRWPHRSWVGDTATLAIEAVEVVASPAVTHVKYRVIR